MLGGKNTHTKEVKASVFAKNRGRVGNNIPGEATTTAYQQLSDGLGPPYREKNIPSFDHAWTRGGERRRRTQTHNAE